MEKKVSAEAKEIKIDVRKRMEIESEYELELDRVIAAIEQEDAKVVCIQFPRGLAAKATEIAEFIEANTQAKCLIWVGPTFGACDLPVGLDKLQPKVDLLIHFGHAAWKYKADESVSEVSVHEV